MTLKIGNSQEKISLHDLACAQALLTSMVRSNMWTYAFHITSDSVPQREETQS